VKAVGMLWDDRIGRRLRLKDLHTLQTVAELGSMAKASQHLALSQPAISKAIADMEHTLGAPLLDRTSRGVELTECGRALMERARVIFDEIRLGVDEIENWTDPTQGEVRIGTTEPASGIVSEIISRLAGKHPRITYRVSVSDTDTLGRELRDRTLDVLLTGWVTPLVADDLTAEVMYRAPLAVMADKSHRLVARKKVKLADLMEERWTLSPPDTFLGRIVVEAFRRRRLQLPPTAVTTVSTSMRLNLLANGNFLTVLPTGMLRQRSSRAWLRALDVELGASLTAALITVKKRRSAGAVELFQEASRAVCREVFGASRLAGGH
jgi:DNA-binding transcriptional LysR family regulator